MFTNFHQHLDANLSASCVQQSLSNSKLWHQMATLIDLHKIIKFEVLRQDTG